MGAAAGAAPLWSESVELKEGVTGSFTIPAGTTWSLASGRYELLADLPGFTCAAQPVSMGEPIYSASPFRTTLHGDYVNAHPDANVWEFADEADRTVERSRKLGINQYVDRIFNALFPADFPRRHGRRGAFE